MTTTRKITLRDGRTAVALLYQDPCTGLESGTVHLDTTTGPVLCYVSERSWRDHVAWIGSRSWAAGDWATAVVNLLDPAKED